MRDLGLVRTRKFGDNYEPRFSDRAEALENYFFASRLEVVREAQGVAVPCEPLAEWPAANFSSSASLRDELALVRGRKLEETGDRDAALQLYKAGESAQCSERAMRLLLAVGPREEARRYIERCIDDPRSDEEWLVAKDLYARKFHKKRTSDMTDMLRAAEIVDIDESRSGRPERAVAEHFERLGCTAYRSENLLWRTLFGLLFWDELFAGDTASVASPFEFLPPMLANGTFYGRYRKAIEKKLASLADRGVTKRSILMASTRHYGTPNGVFRWRESMNDAVIALLDAGDGKAIAQVLGAMAKNYSDRRYGYPDLMVVGADGLRFIEVKTPGDQLRRNQVLRIRELREAGMRADVVRVRWILDPAQTYVVVDVETTGGKGEGHRVTEIGAVKVRDGKVVDRFQTLLNPQRTIPANISRLTGITPAMVQDAPYFADIADDLEAFLEDSIFVAHNVEFDYGFMAREFARIGRPFHYPKLCTCASMRRLFPGHRSYSLASLCRRYDISLNQHHRALCDAEAAAELLLLINEKRMSAND
jgi:DNA polymerase-3 subunit epsilon